MGNTRQRVRDYVSQHAGVDEIDDSEDLFQSGLVSSLFAIQLLAWIERAFGTKVAPEDLDIANFSSVERITAFVGRKRAQNTVDGQRAAARPGR